MGSARAAIFFAIAAFVLATSLQGCGNKPAPTPTPTPPPSPPTTTTTTTTTTASSEWTLPPIEVKGSHLYDSKTGKEFRAKGIGMPNSGEDVKEWIAVLQRIKSIASSLNVVRLYELPTCALVSDCFKGFMLEADKLGVYVLAPGTGTTWGWLPGSASACTPATADGCYKAGAVLGWGQTIIQRFNYPNTLAIVMGNEFDMQMLPFIPALKAYVRDLKAHMKMCNTNDASLTKGQMRSIPLMYACSDDRGNEGVFPKADYMFCDTEAGKVVYDGINSFIAGRQYPGSFFFSEMGCSKTNVAGHVRTWTQVHDFFNDFPAIDGFTAYTYSGNKDFDMFDSPLANATENEDGHHFFSGMKALGDEPQTNPAPSQRPTCPSTILGDAITSYHDVQTYNTGPAGEPSGCPKPYQNSNDDGRSDVVVV
mmetsp:Transcript_124340/g.398146  ORF Transcript_124340/g.398146 Transcript_124340/m.398146 type:complete len:423 (+) Transcript_124340:209-1477(+)